MSDVYQTLVFRHTSNEVAIELGKEFQTRFPFGTKAGDTCITAMSWSDVMSSESAMRMALECSDLDGDGERIELALDLADCDTWADCRAKALEWGLEIKDGRFVDATAQKPNVPNE